MKFLKTTLFILIAGLLFACGGSQPTKFVKSPIDRIITKYIDYANYSVILSDMDYKEVEDKYYHKYRILLVKEKLRLDKTALEDTTATADDVEIVDTDWKEVSPITFEDHKNDLGMTVLSKEDGVLYKNTAPAGANAYVGNERYGSWQTHHNGGSFWVFYGRYRLMSDLFYGPRYGYGGYYGYRRNDWNTYRNTYRGKDDYYGSKRQYGTSSQSNKNTNWGKKSQSFKSRVNSKVAKSSSALKSRGYTSSKRYAKTTRNSSRFSNSSSSRSRSGGFGK